MPESGEPTISALARHLTTDRLAPYLVAAHDDPRQAFRLYRWNIELSGAVYEALHVFEVVLRNALDSQLCRWNARQYRRDGRGTLGADWLLDPAPLLRRLVRDSELVKARGRAERSVNRRRLVVHGDLVAQLSFGTWRYLLPDRDAGRRLLWQQSLQFAFPHLGRAGASRDHRELVSAVDDLYRLRNRVAHLEPLLLMRALDRQVSGAREVLTAIDPVVSHWFDAAERIVDVAARRPTS